MLVFSLLLVRHRFNFEIPGEEHTFTQPLDHFDSHSNATLEQRYFVNDKYAADTNVSKLIVYIGGEAELSETKITSGAVTILAERTKAVLLALEHRFFGKSYPKDVELTTDVYKFLTINQALEDLNLFINASVEKYCADPEHCTVAVVGGSYPGSLSSWMRLKYPSTVAASWASSAPVWVTADFYQYDQHVNDMLVKLKGETCRRALRMVYEKIDSLIGGQESADVKRQLGFKDDQDDVSVLYVIADSVAGPIQYKKWQYLLDDLCESIGDGKDWTTFVGPFKRINNATGGTPQSMDLMTLTNTSLESEDRDARSWTWMTCNEVGWFQTGQQDEDKGLRSSRVNIGYFDRVCTTLFGVNHSDPGIVDLRYGSNNPQSTNVYFVNGATDPWSELSVKEADHRLERYAAVAKQGAHCSELSVTADDDSDLIRVRQRVIAQMQNWMERADMSLDLCKNGGTRILTKCKCVKGWGGPDCATETVRYIYFKSITVSAVAITTALLLILGVFIWMCGRREESEFGARPTLYTN